MLYAKMLKETETEEKSLFRHIFIIGGISIGAVGPPYPLGYVYAHKQGLPKGELPHVTGKLGHSLKTCAKPTG